MGAEWRLGEESELRLQQARAGEPVTVMLTGGSAEVLGCELPPGRKVHLTGESSAVFTYHGCTLTVDGAVERAYVNDETPMIFHLNAHAVLQRRRESALENSSPGPRCMLAGPPDSGKSSLCSLLCNYASRSGSVPLRVDLDPSLNEVASPGTVAAAAADSPVGPGQEDSASPSAPIAYGYPYSLPCEHPQLWMHCVHRIAKAAQAREDESALSGASGIIVDTPPCSEECCSVQQLAEAARALSINTILVLGDDALRNDLEQEFKKASSVEVVEVPKSGGALRRSIEARKREQAKRLKHYFYGSDGSLTPSTRMLSIDDLTTLRIGGTKTAPQDTLPANVAARADPLHVQSSEPGMDLLQHLLVIPHTQEEESAASAACAGLVHVTQIDTSARAITLLCPGHEALPSRFGVVGSLRWVSGE